MLGCHDLEGTTYGGSSGKEVFDFNVTVNRLKVSTILNLPHTNQNHKMFNIGLTNSDLLPVMIIRDHWADMMLKFSPM